MLTTVQDTVAQVPWQAWAALLSLTTLAIGHLTARKAGDRTKTRTPDPKKRRTLTGFLGMGLVTVAGFALSTNTSARFAEKRLHMEAPLTMTIGLALEAIVLGLSVYSWAFNDKGVARVVYALVFAQAIGAVEVTRFEGEDLGTAFVRMVGPVMLAYGLHKLLGLEAKLGKIQITSDGILARMWTDQKNRLESRLGIGSRGADAQAISRSNAADRFVNLNSVGKPKTMTEHRYRRALVKAAAFPAAPTGQTEDTDQPHTAEPQPRSNPATTEAERKARAFRVYADLGQPSQRAFIKQWRQRGYGESDQTLRDLYNEMHEVFQKAQKGNAADDE
jgi:hypothetical protein